MKMVVVVVVVVRRAPWLVYSKTSRGKPRGHVTLVREHFFGATTREAPGLADRERESAECWLQRSKEVRGLHSLALTNRIEHAVEFVSFGHMSTFGCRKSKHVVGCIALTQIIPRRVEK